MAGPVPAEVMSPSQSSVPQRRAALMVWQSSGSCGDFALIDGAAHCEVAMTPTSKVILSVLAATAVLQAGVLFSRSRPEKPSGPTLGSPLPSLIASELDSGLRRPLTGADSNCAIVVAISTTCGVCKRMRTQWAARYAAWSDSVRAPIEVIWVAAADSNEFANFFAGNELNDIRRLRLDASDERFRDQLGVYATPTIYLLDRENRLRTGSLGFTLPPVDSAVRACRATV